jgi:hypothetical protein
VLKIGQEVWGGIWILVRGPEPKMGRGEGFLSQPVYILLLCGSLRGNHLSPTISEEHLTSKFEAISTIV